MKLLILISLLIPFNLFAQNASIDIELADKSIESSLAFIEEDIDRFRTRSEKLHEISALYCAGDISAQEVREALISTYRSWVRLDMYQFGPIEHLSAALSVNFWPDKKSFVRRHITQFDAVDDAQKSDPSYVRTLSAAVQGLPAAIYLWEMDKCPELEAVSGNVALYGQEIHDEWFKADGWADLMKNYGEGNPVYTNAKEVLVEIYSAADFGLQRAAMRLEQPMGSFHNPLPNRAEAADLGISLELVHEQITAITALLERSFNFQLAENELDRIRAISIATLEKLGAITEPLDVAVAAPNQRIPVENAIKSIKATQLEFSNIIGTQLGLNAGFSPADGD